MADGFLGRWSRRKLDVTQGRPVETEPPVEPRVATGLAAPMQAVAAPPVEVAAESASQQQAPVPTLEDVAALTPQSDFSRFAATDVPPEVRNAAMKKLFADPHYNVMDGLDVYIDDYSVPDPLPRKMLESLASARFLGLFQEEKTEDGGEPLDTGSDTPPGPQYDASPQPAPTGGPGPDAALATDPASHDADPDLRLQQDHAPGPEGPGDGAR